MKATDIKPPYIRLKHAQNAIRLGKNGRGKNGNFRSNEELLAVANPVFFELDLILVQTDEMIIDSGNEYVLSKSVIMDAFDGAVLIEGTGIAGMEQKETFKKGSATPQQFLATSSYARKRSLEGVLMISNEASLPMDVVEDIIDTKKGDTIGKEKAEALVLKIESMGIPLNVVKEQEGVIDFSTISTTKYNKILINLSKSSGAHQ